MSNKVLQFGDTIPKGMPVAKTIQVVGKIATCVLSTSINNESLPVYNERIFDFTGVAPEQLMDWAIKSVVIMQQVRDRKAGKIVPRLTVKLPFIREAREAGPAKGTVEYAENALAGLTDEQLAILLKTRKSIHN